MVDSRGFEPLTPRVQGEYSTSLNYKPNDCLNNYESLIVVFWNICNPFIVIEIDFFMAKMESVISLKTGDNAPEFNLKGIDDQMHSLNNYSKKGLLVIFMCNHCPFVKAKKKSWKK